MSFIELTAFAVIFMLLSISIGRFVLEPLRIEIEDPAVLCCGGLTPLLIALFYAQETVFAVPLIWLWLALSIVAAIATLRNREISGTAPIKKLLLKQVIITTILVGLIYAFLIGRDGPASLANNDIYNWYSVASTLIGKARYLEMSPRAAETWPIFSHDGYGTNWMLALVGFFYRDPINSASLFLVITSSWLALILQWQFHNLFSLGRRFSVFLSIIPVTSTFYLYLAFNSFFAQLLGTIGGALLLSVIIRLHRDRNTSIAHNTVFLLLPVLWGLYVYQSGFLAFQFISVGYAFFLFLSSKPYRDGPNRFAVKFLVPYCLALAIAAITNPRLATYLLDRTLTVSNVAAGWPLPLLPAYMFAGIPWPDLADWLYSGIASSQPFFYLGLPIGLIIFIRNHSGSYTNKNKRMILMLGIWYLILVGIYLYWFYSVESSYQNWKFAAFFLLSSNALPLGILALTAKTFLGSQANETHQPLSHRRSLSVAVAFIVIMLAILFNLLGTKKRLTKLGPAIEQLVQVREYLEKDTKLNLILGDYGHSMLPMLLLSPKASIYPLAKTYISPSTIIATGPDATNLISVECSQVLQRYFGQTAFAGETLRTKNYVVNTSTKNLGFAYRFNSDSEHCSLDSSVAIDFGFADPEPWGLWSADRKAQLSVDIPPSLRGKELELYLNVQPYIFGPYKEQRMTIAVNGKSKQTLSLFKPEILAFKLDPAVSEVGQIKLFFEFPDARKPVETDTKSTDLRTLAVGFIDLGLRASN